MDSETIDKLLHLLVIINEEAKAINKAMEVIEASFGLIKNLKPDIDNNYNRIFIELKKLADK